MLSKRTIFAVLIMAIGLFFTSDQAYSGDKKQKKSPRSEQDKLCQIVQFTDRTIDVVLLTYKIKGQIPRQTDHLNRKLCRKLRKEGFRPVNCRNSLPIALVVLNPWDRIREHSKDYLDVGLLSSVGAFMKETYIINIRRLDLLDRIMYYVGYWHIVGSQIARSDDQPIERCSLP